MKHFPYLLSWKGLTFCLALFLFAPNVHAQQGPFAGLGGSWTGNGTITLGNGGRERLRCRAQYSVGNEGNQLQQTLRCASDSYRFDLSSNVNSQGGQLSGFWSEASRGMSGMLFGTARPGNFQVVVTSPSFSANLNLTTQGDRQSVQISAPPGGQLTGVSIVLARAR